MQLKGGHEINWRGIEGTCDHMQTSAIVTRSLISLGCGMHRTSKQHLHELVYQVTKFEHSKLVMIYGDPRSPIRKEFD